MIFLWLRRAQAFVAAAERQKEEEEEKKFKWIITIATISALDLGKRKNYLWKFGISSRKKKSEKQ